MTPPQQPAVLVDVVVIDERVDSAEMLQRLRTLALAGTALREVVSGATVSVDTQFDPDFHVRLETLPDPRSLRELKRLASRLVAEPLASGRPGWTIHYVEKVARRRSALIVRRLAAYDERLIGALTGNPLHPSATDDASGFDYTSLLGAAQRFLTQPDPVNALVDRGATIAARVMQEFERPAESRSPRWSERSGTLAYQDLRIERLAIQHAAASLQVDERAIILALLAETAALLHVATPIDTLQCGIATRRRDSDRLEHVSLPLGAMPFTERVHAVQELLVHLPQSATNVSVDLGAWIPPALSSLIDRRARSMDLACVFAEPLAPLAGVGVQQDIVMPYVSLLGAAVAMVATVDGEFIRLGFSVDKSCATSAEEVRSNFESAVHTHIGVQREPTGFSRWWAALRRPSTTA